MEEFLKDSIYLQEARLTTERELNKSLLTISSGAFALSITIVQFLIGTKFNYLEILYASWLFLAISMILCLIFYKNKTKDLENELSKLKYYYFKSEREKHDEAVKNDIIKKIREDIENKLIRMPKNFSKKIIEYLKSKLTVIISFNLFVGIALLTLFTCINLNLAG
tara:strand:- start:708 stop:1205 length:498 start_codon:yes stop_codon:yes gene_type:complete